MIEMLMRIPGKEGVEGWERGDGEVFGKLREGMICWEDDSVWHEIY